MKCNFVRLKLKDKSNITSNNNKVLEIFKLSIGNNIINLNYYKNKKEPSKKSLEIIYFKKYIEKDIGKMFYIKPMDNKEYKYFIKNLYQIILK